MNYQHEIDAVCARHGTRLWIVEVERGKTMESCRECDEERTTKMRNLFVPKKNTALHFSAPTV